MKEKLGSAIKENKDELDLSDCGLNGSEIKYELMPKRHEMQKLNLGK